MREKSSSMLTSFCKRRALRWSISSRLRRSGSVVSAQGILDRAEHEGERSSELMADVREEGRLGAVEFGETFGPLPLFLVSIRVRDGQRACPRAARRNRDKSRRRHGTS